MFLHRKLNLNEKRSFAGGVTAKNSPLFLATDSSNKWLTVTKGQTP